MEKETKRCPYCGEEILAVAKKCKYCGEWLVDETPQRPISSVAGKVEPTSENAASTSEKVEPVIETDEEQTPGWLEYFFYQPIVKHYFDFKSCLGRKQFWLAVAWFALFSHAICGAVLLLIDKDTSFLGLSRSLGVLGITMLVVGVATIIPILALYVRRLRDAGLDWKWVLTLLIPYIGPIILLVKLCKAGEQECAATKAKPIDYIALVVSILLIVAGYSQGIPYMVKAVQASRQMLPMEYKNDDALTNDNDTLAVDGTDAVPETDEDVSETSNSTGDDYEWLCERPATDSDLADKSPSELRIMRNYIFARHGYIFRSDDLREYFSQYDWYVPTSSNVTGELSQLEKDNISLIKAYE